MKTYFENRADVAEYVYDLLSNSKADLPWTMTITPEKSGGFYVATVIGTSSEDTDEAQELLRATFFSQTQVNT